MLGFNKPLRELEKPNPSYSFYWIELLLIISAILCPIIAWLIWQDRSMLARFGSVMVFLSVLAEFIILHKSNIKHLNNAIRVKDGKEPKDYSDISSNISIFALLVALIGTVIWGFANV